MIGIGGEKGVGMRVAAGPARHWGEEQEHVQHVGESPFTPAVGHLEMRGKMVVTWVGMEWNEVGQNGVKCGGLVWNGVEWTGGVDALPCTGRFGHVHGLLSGSLR